MVNGFTFSIPHIRVTRTAFCQVPFPFRSSCVFARVLFFCYRGLRIYRYLRRSTLRSIRMRLRLGAVHALPLMLRFPDSVSCTLVR